MSRLIVTLSNVRRKIIKIGLNNMFEIVERKRHVPLEGSLNTLKAKKIIFVGEGPPRRDKGCFVLIGKEDINLVISKKSIHKGKYLTQITFVDDFVDKGTQIVIFRTSLINISIVDTNMYSPLFLGYWNNIGNTICQWCGVNKNSLENFFKFTFYGSCLLRVN